MNWTANVQKRVHALKASEIIGPVFAVTERSSEDSSCLTQVLAERRNTSISLNDVILGWSRMASTVGTGFMSGSSPVLELHIFLEKKESNRRGVSTEDDGLSPGVCGRVHTGLRYRRVPFLEACSGKRHGRSVFGVEETVAGHFDRCDVIVSGLVSTEANM